MDYRSGTNLSFLICLHDCIPISILGHKFHGLKITSWSENLLPSCFIGVKDHEDSREYHFECIIHVIQ